MIEFYHPRLRLMHLISPSLPTGAFSYSQGLEWAIETGWVKNAVTLKEWLTDLIRQSQTFVDIPILKRMYQACCSQNEAGLAVWCEYLLALRETSELRLEEQQRGRAMAALLEGLQIYFFKKAKVMTEKCQLAGFALAAAFWEIPIDQAAAGYLWSWMENQVLTGIKAIPLGQTQGHKILSEMDKTVMESVRVGLEVEDEEIGASSPALAIASCLHEIQYTRLYRS